MKHKIAITSLALVLTVSPAFAQFGGIVFDPTNYNNAVLRYLQLQQQLQQLQQSYNVHMQQFSSFSLRLANSRTWWLVIVLSSRNGRT